MPDIANRSSVPFSVVNKITACKNANNKVMPRASLKYLVVHRTDLHIFDPHANPQPVPDDLLDGEMLAARFKNPGLGTGGATPYHFLIRKNDPDYTVEQLLPLSLRGAHAMNWNWCSIGIALVGDFRKAPPPQVQGDNLIKLCAALIPINGGLEVVGHTDLPNASADPNKICPGSYLPAKIVAAQALNKLPTNWKSWPPATIDWMLAQCKITP